MRIVRCPRCAASVAPDAAWCSLCFADFREAAAPLSAPVAHGAPMAPVAPDPLTAPLASLATPVLDAPAADPPVMTATAVAAPGWPCSRCAAVVPLTEAACDNCGAGFLAESAGALSLRLPLVGDLAHASMAAKVGVMGAGAIALALALFCVYLLLGLFV